jgi:hypothetical protein
VVVSQAPADIHKWGPWQFPNFQYLPDGRIVLRFHVAEDAASAYGEPSQVMISADGGTSWTKASDADQSLWGEEFITLANGDLLRQDHLRAVPYATYAGKSALPSPIDKGDGLAKHGSARWNAAGFPTDLNGFHFSRMTSGSSTWKPEVASVHIPGETRYATGGVIVRPYFHRMLTGPDGTPWAAHYAARLVDGKPTSSEAIFLNSKDDGHTWNTVSTIPFVADLTMDPGAAKRGLGYTEPNLGFPPDGSIFTLLRTTGGARGIGPLYYARSTDGTKTWTRARVFDDCGVWPAILTLKNGVTVSSYGRPGLYVRATADPSAQVWDPRVTIVTPGQATRETCSYSALQPVNDHEFLIAYSDFHYPAPDGSKRKTILVRRIEARKTGK